MVGFAGGAKPGFVILHENAPNHARRIGVEMLRHKQFVVPIEPLDRARLEKDGYGNAVIIAKSIPPTGKRRYAVVRRPSGDAAIQVWVKDSGRVWADTDPLVEDLLRFSPVRREEPTPFPDALLDLGQRFGRLPTDRVRVQVSASEPMLIACGTEMVESATSLDRRRSLQEIQVKREDLPKPFVLVGTTMPGNLTEMVVAAQSLAGQADRPAWVTVTLTLPLTYCVVSSRGSAGWDRMADPVQEYHDPDGSKRLVFRLHPGDGSTRKKISLTLTNLPTGERSL